LQFKKQKAAAMMSNGCPNELLATGQTPKQVTTIAKFLQKTFT